MPCREKMESNRETHRPGPNDVDIKEVKGSDNNNKSINVCEKWILGQQQGKEKIFAIVESKLKDCPL